MPFTPQNLGPVAQIGLTTPISREKISSQIDLAISLLLSDWEALSIAVENNLGGPDSADKRDFLAGAISELFTERPDTDAQDVEEVLQMYMEDEFSDEFGALIQDESDGPLLIAEKICLVRRECLRGDFGRVEKMWAKFQQRQGRNQTSVQFQQADGEEDDDGEEGEDEGDMDEDMDEAPPLVQAPKEKAPPDVDEDGFTKVIGKKRR
ncbi:MAG: hypothetical protein M1834_003748 [Cirrosporium novae-zelandiae]|nr:MAG: hypothetical protein M1834_003748 [Cirrosporium novae-zelandiae]